MWRAALTLRNRETQVNFPVKLSWQDGDTSLTVDPVGRYSIASFYDLTIDRSARAQDGGTLQESYQKQLSTLPLPRIEAVSPQSGKQSSFSDSMYIDFASPMNYRQPERPGADLAPTQAAGGTEL